MKEEHTIVRHYIYSGNKINTMRKIN